jgi:hypothetical protein
MAGARHVHDHQNTVRHALRRRTEDVDYWRKRSGWFDDDKAMKEYNDGVYDTYYQLDDDRSHRSRSSFSGAANSDLVKNSIKVLAVVVAVVLCLLMFRALNRRFGGDKESKKKRPSSTGRSERSSSRTRSRSRSRRGDYDLMSDDNNEKSHSRSRSKSGRSRSRTRARSRSASRRGESEKAPPAAPAEPVLV